MSTLLNISNLYKAFGGNRLLENVSLELSNSTVSLLTGDNGTGKSTLFNIITGYDKADKGSIQFEGKNVEGNSPVYLSKKGVSRLFQTPRVFQNLTIEQNLKIATKDISPGSLGLLELLGLRKHLKATSGNLSFGQQKLVSFCTILASRPKLILLDEPLAGLANSIIPIVKAEIYRLKKNGVTFFIIEHRKESLRDLCDKEYCLMNQKIVQL